MIIINIIAAIMYIAVATTIIPALMGFDVIDDSTSKIELSETTDFDNFEVVKMKVLKSDNKNNVHLVDEGGNEYITGWFEDYRRNHGPEKGDEVSVIKYYKNYKLISTMVIADTTIE